LQKASYSVHLVNLVRQDNVHDFERIIQAGVSPNPCNPYGESLVHMVCRRGAAPFLRVLLENGCDFRVSDDMGRTPAHDACWSSRPCFDVVRMILQQDPFLFQLTDCRGSTPLQYVPKKDWAAWLQFLECVKEEYWPQRNGKLSGDQPLSELALQPPNSRPLPDPMNALPERVASLISSGVVDPRDPLIDAMKDEDFEDKDTACLSSDSAEEEDETSSSYSTEGDETEKAIDRISAEDSELLLGMAQNIM
jgi:hypothetical protein